MRVVFPSMTPLRRTRKRRNRSPRTHWSGLCPVCGTWGSWSIASSTRDFAALRAHPPHVELDYGRVFPRPDCDPGWAGYVMVSGARSKYPVYTLRPEICGWSHIVSGAGLGPVASPPLAAAHGSLSSATMSDPQHLRLDGNAGSPVSATFTQVRISCYRVVSELRCRSSEKAFSPPARNPPIGCSTFLRRQTCIRRNPTLS